MPGPGELPAPIIGRDAGQARLRALVDPIPQSSQVFVVTGEAGMGKTVLLAEVAGRGRAAGIRVLSVTGRESESKLAFAGLHQLRTVSSHLYRSYPKLGIASRHQLPNLIARASTPTPAHESAESRTLL